MSTESLHRTSEIVETPSQYVETPKRVNVDVLKQRLLEEKKKEKVKRTIILLITFSSICAEILGNVFISLKKPNMNKSEIRVNPFWTTLVCKIYTYND